MPVYSIICIHVYINFRCILACLHVSKHAVFAAVSAHRDNSTRVSRFADTAIDIYTHRYIDTNIDTWIHSHMQGHNAERGEEEEENFLIIAVKVFAVTAILRVVGAEYHPKSILGDRL